MAFRILQMLILKIGRGERICTFDLLAPNQGNKKCLVSLRDYNPV